MNSYKKLYIDYLDTLKEEISLYKNEENLRKLDGKINNTPGNLCLHICGNLNHYIGAAIGETGYTRYRDLEFSKRNFSREELINGIEETKKMIEKIFDRLTLNDVDRIYPKNDFGDNITYGFVFAKLISHLSYHIGQINYHRRLLDI